jgi:hypothetical protein
MSQRWFSDEPWETWEAWYCTCGKHSFSPTYIQYSRPGEATCSRCKTEPQRFARINQRKRRPSWCEQEAASA